MTTIESKEVNIAANSQVCFDFLMDLNNYELLLPKDSISDWQSDEKKCSFKIQKTYKLALVYSDSNPTSQITVVSGDGSPFKFDLKINLSDKGDSTDAQLVCNADINPFLKMMVQKPLNNLFDYMADRMVKVLGENEA
jgi:carbon monoxide dehydrogenase subunit G